MATKIFDVFLNQQNKGKLKVDTTTWEIETEDPYLLIQLGQLYEEYNTTIEKSNKTKHKEIAILTYPGTPTIEKLNVLLNDLGFLGYVFTR